MTIKDRRFIIDAGHGGRYDGAVAPPLLGSNVSRKEKDVTLKVAQRVVSKLRASGGIVWPTRTIDKDFNGTTIEDDINRRVVYINTLPAVDYLVSIHVNRQFSGKGVYYQEGSIASKGLAQVVAVASDSRAEAADFAILRDTKKASHRILIEISSITDSRLDEDDYLNDIVDGIVKGLFAHNIA